MNKDAYFTTEWWQLQALVLREADHICQDCDWPCARVAHHLTYANGIICPPADLVALCTQCHLVRHGLSNWRMEPYTEHMARQGWERVTEGGPGCRWEAGRYWRRVPRQKPG